MDRKAIEKRLNAITPGPWSWAETGEKDNSWGLGVAYLESDEECTTPLTGCVHFALDASREAGNENEDYFVETAICTNDGSADGTFRDADFIAHAPQDIADLLAENTRLEERMSALEAAIERHNRKGTFGTEIDV